MREILFKAKRKDNGEWVECNLIVFEEDAYIMELENTYIRTHYTGGNCVEFDMKAYKVDKNTICQYTGLTDKNGNKIWENDIVNGHEKRGAAFFQCVVKHNDRKARFDVEAMGCMFPLCIEEYYEDFFMNGLDYEVIGNIFDNPELLGGQ